MKLCTRDLVKDLLGQARADTKQNPVINALIQQVSAQAQRTCRRDFEKKARVEYYKSYEQMWADPDPQFIHLNSWPVDPDAALKIVWAAYNNHDTSGIILDRDRGDYSVDVDTGIITVSQATGVLSTAPLAISGLPVLTYNMRGFQVTWTGGYTVNSPDNPDSYVADPLDDYGVLQVPEELQFIIAQKVVETFNNKVLTPWTPDEERMLRPFQKKDIFQ